MEWISVKDQLPEHEGSFWVKNDKGWMNGVVALYYPDQQVFVNYDPGMYNHFTLDVTHWVELPY